MIAVSVRMLGDVRRFARESPDGSTWQVDEGATVADLLGSLGVPGDEELIIGVNNTLAGRDSQLAAGDSVLLVTPMAGG